MSVDPLKSGHDAKRPCSRVVFTRSDTFTSPRQIKGYTPDLIIPAPRWLQHDVGHRHRGSGIVLRCNLSERGQQVYAAVLVLALAVVCAGERLE